MKNTKNYILLAVLVFAGYGSTSAYAMDLDIFGNDDQEEYQQLKQVKITIVDAIQKAQAAHPDMVVSGVEFEEEGKTPAYTVELLGEKGDEIEVTVSARTGKIISEDD